MSERKVSGPTERRELNFRRCPKHGTEYPKGAECPDCRAEKAKRD